MLCRLLGAAREKAIEALIRLSGYSSIVIVALIVVFVTREGIPLFREYRAERFFLGDSWQPTLAPPSGPRFGLLPNLWGSFLVTAGAALIGIPLGVGSAICLAEVAPRLMRDILKPLVELIAMIPSVAIGFVGAAAVTPLVKNLFHLDTGKSALTGAVMLAFMAVPTIVTISDDALKAVPRAYRDASLALGGTRWQGVSRVVVPAAFPGIVAAVMLGIGRAVGETMVVIMVTGNAGVMPQHGLWYAFTHSVRTITGTIGAEALEVAHGDLHYRALFMLAMVLLGISMLLNLGADLALRRVPGRAQ